MNRIQDREIWKVADVQTLDNGRRTPVIKHWLSDCQQNHAACVGHSARKSQAKVLPTRVIDVQSSPITLHESVANEVGSYAALSYCWGPPGTTNLCTTQGTLESRKSSLFLDGETIPGTLQDAITITGSLGIRYLWIDALCIVQDDVDDWEKEAAKMQTVYANAEVTLAATDSTDCNGGLFHDTKPSLLQFTEKHTYRSRKLFACLEKVESELYRTLDRSPLNQRGWTFQESLLSRRLVHFSDVQLVWECKTQVATEYGLLAWGKGEQSKRPFALLPARGSQSSDGSDTPPAPEDWDALVESFSSRRFTKNEDRVSAMAGVVLLFEAALRDIPLAGLWKRDLAAGLLWYLDTPSESDAPPELTHVPSWSWMSLMNSIRYDPKRRRSVSYGDKSLQRLEIRNAALNWAGTPLTSKISFAWLELSGLVLPYGNVASETRPSNILSTATRETLELV
ncbi:hypothetical protein SLS58_010950 [Diplodia intermedia]|uniref:Heterokaryon incompatibility domain-containing protein n=1 Tax=Diplodia intermedia TaxID=856260 RepID=A0ABR3T2F9_9PEZI